jgi:hypothetical protein
MVRLRKLDAELAELIARTKWEMYLGYDARAVDFVKKLELPADLGGRRPI